MQRGTHDGDGLWLDGRVDMGMNKIGFKDEFDTYKE